MKRGVQVSVIIPSFNRAAYIEETVQSVLQQTLAGVELLVIDDGSTDGTYELLCRYSTRGALTLLTHPDRHNKGQSASINLGLECARGEFISVLDSDDLFAPTKLERMVDYLQNHRDVGLVYSNGYAINAEDDILYDILPQTHNEVNDPNNLLMDCYFLLPQNAITRREVFLKAGFFEESFRSAQDHDMLLRIAELTNVAYLPEYLFYYRRHGDSISSKHQDLRWKTGFEILERARRRYPYRRAAIRKRRAVLHYRMGEVFWRRGHRLWALPRFAMSGALDPLRAVRVALGKERAR